MDIEKILDEKSKRKQYYAEYYQKTKGKKKEYAHQYYLNHQEEINERNREWARNNKAKSARIFYRQKDVLNALKTVRKLIGDNSYYLLINELNKAEKHTFKVKENEG